MRVFFSQPLSPAGQGGGQCLDTYSTTTYPSTCPRTPFEAGFVWLFIPCLVCVWLACQGVLQRAEVQTNFSGPLGGPAANFANKLWGNCLKIWSQT